MKTSILVLGTLLFMNLSFSQKKISITNTNSNKEIIIKENKRIRIKTTDGRKISGKFKILDNQSIEIKNTRIELSKITKIKRSPLFLSITTPVVFIYSGSILVGAGVLIAALTGSSEAFLLTIPGTGLIYGGIKSPNFLKGYKTNKDWKYQIITANNQDHLTKQ